MAKVIFAPLVEEDIDEARRFTRKKWGPGKDAEYRDLILLAVKALEENPRAGRRRPDIFPYAWTYHIGRPGKAARHLFLYRIALDGTVEVGRFLYDGMDLPGHVPKDW